MSRKTLVTTLLLASLTQVTGCVQSSASTQASSVSDILAIPPQTLFSSETGQLNIATFERVTLALAQEKSASNIDTLLTYLRAFSYFSPIDTLDNSHLSQLSQSLQTIATNRNIKGDRRLQEQFAVTLYRYFADDKFASLLAPLLPSLQTQLKDLANTPPSLASDYALWETLRAYGFLLNQSRKNPTGELNLLLLSQEVNKPLLQFVASANSIRENSDWPKTNAYWALAMYRLALPSGTDGNITADEHALDDAVNTLAQQDVAIRGQVAKDAFTLGYHVNHFAGREECINNSGLCHMPSLEAVLPEKHTCSATLFIRHQDLNQEELAESCHKLTSQEAHFHLLLQTQNSPTANDNNQALQVVAFKNWSQYNAYGQLIFDISTDNGGMYLEGTPSAPNNQASFFAFRQWWIEPEFAIWNLNHEYVHYLDGRFIKYGGFGHFPNKMVWWSEGLAEYISKGNSNPDAITLAKESLDKAPNLETIFATEYKDGLFRRI